MSSSNSGLDSNDAATGSQKNASNLILRMDQDSNDKLQALFDSVLNPGERKAPLAVPFRMRKLPPSFFNPPVANQKSPSASHSRANSADSAYDAGSQSNVNLKAIATPSAIAPSPETTIACQPELPTNKLNISHSRAHSSPASLQQTYNLQSSNMSVQSPDYPTNVVSFPNDIAAGTALGERMIGAGNPIQSFHMKQRSYDVISPIQLQKELGALPPGWEQARTDDGQIYYLNHNTKTTQWEDPRLTFMAQRTLAQANQNDSIRNANKDPVSVNDTLGPLPEGWEQACTENGDMYFINHINRTTSWNDPRIPDFLKSLKGTKPEMSWINVPFQKENEFFKNKPDKNTLTRPSPSLQIDPFLSGDSHARQESTDSGLSLSSNQFSLNNTDFIPQIDDSMDCLSESGAVNSVNGLDLSDDLVSSLQLEDNMFTDVQRMLTSPSARADNLEWYKIN